MSDDIELGPGETLPGNVDISNHNNDNVTVVIDIVNDNESSDSSNEHDEETIELDITCTNTNDELDITDITELELSRIEEEPEVVVVSNHGKRVCEINNSKTNNDSNNNDNVSDDGLEHNNCIGTSNLAYSSDSIDSLPVILDLNERYRFRYSVVLDDNENSYPDALAGPSTSSSSLGDYNFQTIPLERTCSCNCHRSDEQNAPSYDEVYTDSYKNDTKKVVTSLTLTHDDVNCTGVSCKSIPNRKRAENLMINIGAVRNSPNCTPGNTPGRFRRILPSQMVKILNSSGNSPVSDKAPPNYRSLIFSILQDEPPKYEEVTGKKLADELIDVPSGQNASSNNRVPTFKSRVAGVGIFIGVIIVTVLLLYLSVTGAGTRNASMG